MSRLLLLLALLCVAGEARAEWHRVETTHAVIQADLPEAELRQLAVELETVDALMRTRVPASSGAGGSKADILLIDDVSTVRRLTGLQGFVGGITIAEPTRETVIVARDHREFSAFLGGGFNMRRGLFHEYAHSFMRRYLGSGLPGWFVEGFATYFGTTEVLGPGQVQYGQTAYGPEDESDGTSVPFAEVMAMAAERPDGPPPAKLYAKGWLITHHLFSGGARADEIRKYISTVSAGESVAKPESFFAGGLVAFDADMAAYLKALPEPKRGQVTALDTSSIAVRAMRPGEVRLVEWRLADIHARKDAAGTSRSAKMRAAYQRYLGAKAILDQFPDETELCFQVARLALESGENAAAGALADRLLTARPDDPTLLAFKADVLDGMARDNPKQFGTLVARGRELVRRAAAIAPDNPAVAAAMFRNYSADQGASLETRRYLDRAIELNRGDFELMGIALEFAVRNRDFRYAIKLLTPLANSPHEGQMRSWAIKTIGELRRQR